MSAPFLMEQRDKRRIGPRGHRFDTELACACGQTWHDQQRKPTTCSRIHPARSGPLARKGRGPA